MGKTRELTEMFKIEILALLLLLVNQVIHETNNL